MGDMHVSTAANLLFDLEDAQPERRAQILDDVARIYGEGFARALQRDVPAKQPPAVDDAIEGRPS
jgi:hypothetical protein